MAHTAALGEFFQQLSSDAALQRTFRMNPATAVKSFKLTSHEREAIVTADLEDLVAVGAAPSIESLPEVVRTTSAPGPEITRAVNRMWSTIATKLAAIPLPPFLQRGPRQPPGPGPGG